MKPFRTKKQSIVIEGLPGAGKTSAINMFSGRYKGFHCLSQQNIPQIIFDSKNDLLISNSFLEEEVKRNTLIKKSGQSFLCDRSFISTVAFYYAKDVLENTEHSRSIFLHVEKKAQQLLKNKQCCFFDAYFIFLVDPNVSIHRRKQFSELKYYPWFSPIFLNAMFNFYNLGMYAPYIKNKENVYVLNTSDLTIDDTVNFIEEKIVKL